MRVGETPRCTAWCAVIAATRWTLSVQEIVPPQQNEVNSLNGKSTADQTAETLDDSTARSRTEQQAVMSSSASPFSASLTRHAISSEWRIASAGVASAGAFRQNG